MNNLVKMSFTGDVVDTRIKPFTLTDDEHARINLCKRVRSAALSDNVIVDTSERKGNTNGILFKFLEACGVSAQTFVKQYLAQLQPFCVESMQHQNYDKNIKCLIDPFYKIPLYMKLDVTQHNEIIISFHENFHTTLKDLRNSVPSRLVVLADNVKFMGDAVGQMCTISMYRGISAFTFDVPAICVKDPDVCFVEPSLVFRIFEDDLLNRLLSSGISLSTLDSKSYTFTSYGDTILNTISLLIDCNIASTSSAIRLVSLSSLNFALCELMKDPEHETLLEVLLNRYSNVRSSALDKVLDYVKEVCSLDERIN